MIAVANIAVILLSSALECLRPRADLCNTNVISVLLEALKDGANQRG